MQSAFLYLDDWMVYIPPVIAILPHISIWQLSSVVTHWYPNIPECAHSQRNVHILFLND